MAAGPILIFDKSTLQSLNPDEAMWLDNFFLTNITPLFFIETLADLEKEVSSGRTPEDVVGNLAYKTPDLQSRPNVHHSTLIAGELLGAAEVDMRLGRPHIAGGRPVELGGKTGVIFQRAPEEEALERWQHGDFLQIERMTAKAWRRALSDIDYEEMYQQWQKWFPTNVKPKTLPDVKAFAESIIDSPDSEKSLRFGLGLIGISEQYENEIVQRWQSVGKPPLRSFAPYFRYVFSVDLFFYLGIAVDLISRHRPSHKVDLAYLYYLPFCMVFTSNDHLHADFVPLFLRDNQSFVRGEDLKADLKKLDQHYSSLPQETREKGVSSFASYPPTDDSFLVTRLWDKHLPIWRRHQAELKKRDKKADAEIIKEINRFKDEATPLTKPIRTDAADSMLIHRQVSFRKGKWNRFPPEVLKSEAKS